jgi:mannosyltransferase
VLVKETSLQRGDFWPVECAQPAECLAGTNRVWVVGIILTSPGVFDEMEIDKKDVLLSEFDVKKVWQPSGTNVVLMERKFGLS